MSGVAIFTFLFLAFQIGWAGVLTVRIAEYSFDGRMWVIGYPIYWFIFMAAGVPLLLIALPFRLLGIRIYPVFVPERMKPGKWNPHGYY